MQRDEDAIADELEEIRHQASQPESEGQQYALAMAVHAARLVGASETEIENARTGQHS